MSPPRMLVKLPMRLSTRRNASGRSQAAVKAQMPPELMPQMARSFGSVDSLYCLADLGQDLLEQEAGVAVAERVVLEAAVVARPAGLG